MNSKMTLRPEFGNEAEERQFWETRDSTEYVDWSNAERVQLPNLKPSAHERHRRPKPRSEPRG